MMEEWKEHPRYKGYFVSNTGRVISNVYKSRDREKKPTNRNGRLVLTIYNNGPVIQTQLSRLVAETFLSDFTIDCVVMHLDNNPLNNNLSNLKCGNQSENIKQCVADGRYTKRTVSAEKLTNIKTGLLKGLTKKQISETFNYPYSTVCDIIRREVL